MERRRGQVAQVGQEAAEGAGGLPGLRLGRGSFGRARALDPRHEAPGLPRLVSLVRGAVAGRDEGENPASGIGGAVAREARRDVARDTHHVLHHLVGVVEDVAIDLLEHVAAPAGGRLERRDPRVVDETARVRLERDERAGRWRNERGPRSRRPPSGRAARRSSRPEVPGVLAPRGEGLEQLHEARPVAGVGEAAPGAAPAEDVHACGPRVHQGLDRRQQEVLGLGAARRSRPGTAGSRPRAPARAAA